MKFLNLLIFVSLLLYCSPPKGPQTFNSPMVGKTIKELISVKGVAKEIKVFDKNQAYIYKTKEEYYGKKVSSFENDSLLTPKKVFMIEHIYYINEQGVVYKYQVWKKRVN